MRTTADVLLADIRDKPEDDTPRLVYADWLEEHGGEDAHARAAFIRAQIELARMAEEDPRRAALERTEAGLLADHGANWLRELSDGEGIDAEFRRGFPERVELEGEAFAQFPGLLRRAPVRELLVRNAKGISRLTWGDHLGGLTSLEVAYSDDTAVLRLAASSRLAALRRLRLEDNEQGDALAFRLAASRHLGRLETLIVRWNNIHGPGALSLITSPRLAGVRELHLGNNDIGDDAIVELARRPELARLRGLGLGGHSVGQDALVALAGSPYAAGLVDLSLDAFLVNVPAARLLGQSPLFHRLRRLALTDGTGGTVAGAPVRALLASPGLGQMTDLRLGMAGPATINCLARWPGLARLRVLRLSYSEDLGDESIERLLTSRYLGGLRELELYRVGMGPRGMTALANSPRLAGLRRLLVGGRTPVLDATNLLTDSPYLDRLTRLVVRCWDGAVEETFAPLRRRFGACLRVWN